MQSNEKPVVTKREGNFGQTDCRREQSIFKNNLQRKLYQYMDSKWFAFGNWIKEEVKEETFINIFETNDYISTTYPNQWKTHQK